MRSVIIATIVFFPFQAFAESWTQTSWQTGPDYGQVIPFFHPWAPQSSSENSRFWYSNSIDWYSDYRMKLGYKKNVICDPFETLPPWEDVSFTCTIESFDVDDDADTDVITIGSINGLSCNLWCFYNNGGTWSCVESALMQDLYSWFIPHADIDNDGADDLITNIAIYSANGETIWSQADPLLFYPWNIVIEHETNVIPDAVWTSDMDQDGDNDIITPYVYIDNLCSINWYENLGSGTLWQVHTIAENTDIPWCIHSTDYDNDGDEDIVAAFLEAEQIRLYENTGSGDDWNEHYVCYSEFPASAIFADIDGTGFFDILACDALEDRVYWLKQNASGVWITHIIDNSFDGAWRVEATDFDSDGDIDVAGISRFGHSIVWWENMDGTGQQWISHWVGFCPDGSGMCISDINLDNIPDIVSSAFILNDINWFDISQKATSGELVSLVLDTEYSLTSASINWYAQTPTGTTVYFQIRSGEDIADLTTEEWSDEIYEPGEIGSLERYVQYKVTLMSENPGVTPVLYNVTLNWTELGIEPGEHSPCGFELFNVSPNPARGGAVIRFILPEELHVSLNVFDISGRLVSIPVDAVLSEGEHSVSVEELSTGIYFYRMVSSGFCDIKRMIVME